MLHKTYIARGVDFKVLCLKLKLFCLNSKVGEHAVKSPANVCMYVCIYIYICICSYVHMFICSYVYMFICYIYIYIHICRYVSTDAPSGRIGARGVSTTGMTHRNRNPARVATNYCMKLYIYIYIYVLYVYYYCYYY